jgi:hypothetical protein
LIVLPTVALRQWQSEITRFTKPGALSVCCYHGNTRSSEDPLQTLSTVDVVLTSYKILEIEFRRATAGSKIVCSVCGKKFYPEKLRIHRKYFCGEDSHRTSAQSRTERKNSPKPRAEAQSSSSSGEEETEDEVDRQKAAIKKRIAGRGGRGRGQGAPKKKEPTPASKKGAKRAIGKKKEAQSDSTKSVAKGRRQRVADKENTKGKPSPKPAAKRQTKKRKAQGSASSDSEMIQTTESESDEGEEWFDEEVEKQIVAASKADQKKMIPSLLHSISWFRVICDEAHMIKDRSTSTAKAVFNLVSLNKWCLTGTPLQNRVGELYSLVRFLRIDPFAFYFCKAKGCTCKSLHYVSRSFGSISPPAEIHEGSLRRLRPLSDATLLPLQQARPESYQASRLCRGGQARHAQAQGRGSRSNPPAKNEDHEIRRHPTSPEVTPSLFAPLLTLHHPGSSTFGWRVWTNKRTTSTRRSTLRSAHHLLCTSRFSSQSQAQFNTYVNAGTVLNNYAHIFDILIRLRQVVDHPYLVLFGKQSPDDAQRSDSAEVVCGLCHESPSDARQSRCGHVFCQACITDFLQIENADTVALCPLCSTPLSIAFDENGNAPRDGDWGGRAKVGRRNFLRHINVERFQSSTKLEALMQVWIPSSAPSLPSPSTGTLPHEACGLRRQGPRLQSIRQLLGRKSTLPRPPPLSHTPQILEHRIQKEGMACAKLVGSLTVDSRDKVCASPLPGSLRLRTALSVR